ncbi:U11/U12 small nuclear ribonucleoprotein 25 kDa protein-like [Planococcus citri]|uniref:U11/U12 small nuclear ribonucleoprotein 25 kDa protein-like n=1 Tax=Planococcus citri TaxID=170843 RepID=UPI0031F72311
MEEENRENQDFDDSHLTHEELKKVTESTLNELLKTNYVLQDLPQDVTLEEVEAQIAVLHGRSMTVCIARDNDIIPVIVKQKNSTVSDLKRAFQRAMTLKLRREGEKCKISWKYIWRVNVLSCDGVKLDSNNKFLEEYGVGNKSKVIFQPKIKEKPSKQFRKR